MEELCGGKASQDWPAGKEGRRGRNREGRREEGREGLYHQLRSTRHP